MWLCMSVFPSSCDSQIARFKHLLLFRHHLYNPACFRFVLNCLTVIALGPLKSLCPSFRPPLCFYVYSNSGNFDWIFVKFHSGEFSEKLSSNSNSRYDAIVLTMILHEDPHAFWEHDLLHPCSAHACPYPCCEHKSFLSCFGSTCKGEK